MEISIWNKRFLWHRVRYGLLVEVPVGDVMACDSRRYYFSAGALTIWTDDGIIASRATLALFQCLGLFVGLTSQWR